MWLDYRYHLLPMAETPGFFFYIEPDEWGYGMGFYQASPAAMEQIREHLVADPAKSEKLLKAANKSGLYTLGGESYKRPRAADLPPVTLDLYNHKTFYFIHNESNGPRLYADDLDEELAEGFKLLGPLYRHITGF
jgi:uncharacterized protein (DUF2461 family)